MNKPIYLILLFLLIIASEQSFSQSLDLNNIQSFQNGDDSYSKINQPQFERGNALKADQNEKLIKALEEDLERQTSIEKSYSIRSNTNLFLQGYNFFKSVLINRNLQDQFFYGSTQDDYIVGIGDQLTLVFQGQKNSVINRKVNSNGLLLYDFTTPISAVGRSLGELKSEIKQRVNNSFIETEVYISLSQIGQFNIMISGEVFSPGMKKIFGLSTVVDALIEAGGIKKGGSLRNIKLIRNQEVINIDLYKIIFSSNERYEKFPALKNGDVLLVPFINETVALSGQFSRPGIYEVSPTNKKFTDLLDMSGGFSGPGSFKTSVKSFSKNGQTEIFKNLEKNHKMSNGDIFFSTKNHKLSKNFFKITGAVQNELQIPITTNNTLRKTLLNNKLNDEAYIYSGIIKTKEKNHYKPKYYVFNLKNILDNKNDISLKKEDVVYIFSKSDIDFFSSKTLIDRIKFNENINVKYESCELLNNINRYILGGGKTLSNSYFSIFSDFKGIDFDNELKKENKFLDGDNSSYSSKNTFCPKIFDGDNELAITFLENIIYLKGNVSNPGIHLQSDESNLKDLLDFSGYKNGDVIVSPDNKIVEVTSPSVSLGGAVRFPSKITLEKNRSLSKIINNVKQLKNDAYPVFASIRRIDKYSGNSFFLSFSPEAILSKDVDIKLNDQDEIYIFKKNEINEILENNFDDFENKSTKENDQIFNNDNDNKSLKDNSNLTEKDVLISKTELEAANQSLEANNINNYTNIISDNRSSLDKESFEKNDNNDLAFNKNINKSLQENDIVDFVINNLAQISGEVLRPGFYPVAQGVNVESLIQIAGGPSINANLERIEISGNNNNFIFNKFVYPGNKIYIPNNNDEREKITISGAVSKERKVSGPWVNKLSDLIRSKDDLDPNAYLYFAVIERQFNGSFEKIFYPFSPYEVIYKRQNLELLSGDKIIIFDKDEIHQISNSSIKISNMSPDLSITNFGDFPEPAGSIDELIKRLSIRVEGPLINSGIIFSGSVISLENILQIAGGFSNKADRRSLTISYPYLNEKGEQSLKIESLKLNSEESRDIIISPGSILRFQRLSSDLNLGEVTIEGAVYQPGTYRITNDTTIFDVLKSAGGLKENAFIEGLVFTREEEKRREKISIERLGRELDKSLISAFETQSASNKADPSILVPLRELARQAQDFDAIGRVVGEFTKIYTLKQTTVTNGDKIFIPKKPTSVTVVGEVMTPGSILWNPVFSFSSYIDSAAGFSDLADKKRVFIISPNGKAKRVSRLWSSNLRILPGSTIFVPRKIQLATSLEKLSAITSIVYQLTLSIAGIDNVLND